MRDAATNHQIGAAIAKLLARLEAKRQQLRSMESRTGRAPKSHLPTMNRLREEIRSLEDRIKIGERLQDAQ